MFTDLLARHFQSMGSRIKWRHGVERRRWERLPDFSLDVARDRHGEYFDLMTSREDLEFQVLEVRPADRHLLLLARTLDVSTDFRGGGDARGKEDLSRFLCGHDERHWFVAGVSAVSTVREAKDSLKPAGVRLSELRNGVKPRKRNRRKNAGSVRQGEWFFVPLPHLSPESWRILKWEPLVRGRGKPHMVEFLYREGGTTVYVSPKYPSGLSEGRYRRLLETNQKARGWPWRVMTRNPAAYAKGRVRHPDHKTVVLPFWHRVHVNEETQSVNVAFLD